MDLIMLRAFEDEIKKHVPKFKVAYKDESLFMKLLGFFAVAFNQKFMLSFTTTIGSTVYFPSKVKYEQQTVASFTVLAHEFVHMLDSAKHPLWYPFSYLFPQILAPFVLAAYAIVNHNGWVAVGALLIGVLLGCLAARKSVAFFIVIAGLAVLAAAFSAIFYSHWGAALFFGGLALLAPLPAPWRSRLELRGYTMTLAILAWTPGALPGMAKNVIAQHFFGPNYYFMSWSKTWSTKAVAEAIARTNALKTEAPYSIVYDFLVARKELRVP